VKVEVNEHLVHPRARNTRERRVTAQPSKGGAEAARRTKNKQAEAKGLAGAGVAGGGCTLCSRGGLARAGHGPCAEASWRTEGEDGGWRLEGEWRYGDGGAVRG